MSVRILVRASSFALVVANALAPATAAQAQKLNGPLARRPLGTLELGASHDGRVLVYEADPDGDDRMESHSVVLDGRSDPVVLPTARGGATLTPEGKLALVTFDPEDDGTLALFSVPAATGAPLTQLSASFVAGGGVSEIVASQDGVHAVYLADAETDGVFELYRVRVYGSAPAQKLSPAFVGGQSIDLLGLSRDGRCVLFAVVGGVQRFYFAPVDGSAPPHEVVLPLVAGGQVSHAELDADGTRMLYVADQETDQVVELFAARTDNAAPPVKLSGPMVAGGDVRMLEGPLVGRGFYSPNGIDVLYVADQQVDGRNDLFSVPADGSRAALELSRGALDRSVRLWGTSPDGAWALYESDPSATATRELFSAPVDGSAPARAVSGPMVAGGDLVLAQASPDGALALYVADQETSGVHELYGAPIDGSAAPVKLSPPLQPNGDVAVQFGEAGSGLHAFASGVAFDADGEVDERADLWFAPFPLGTPARRIAVGPIRGFAGAGTAPGDLGQVQFLREGELDVVRVAPDAVEAELETLPRSVVQSPVLSFALAPDGGRAIYHAQEEGDVAPDLYSVSTGERRDAFRMSPSGVANHQHALAADGVHAVFVASAADGAPSGELYAARVDGTTAPVRLDPAPFGAERSFMDPLLGPLGRLVAFSFVDDGATVQSWVAPLDGGAPPIFLGNDAVAPSLFFPARFSADESRIAYHVGSELFVVPTDGSAAPARVSAAGQSVRSDHEFSADASLVFYRAFQTGSTMVELFVAPSDGSGTPLRLNAPLAAGRIVRTFALAPDASRVVFESDADATGRFELFVVPADGSAAPVRLHPAFPANGDVGPYAISPDGARVVYQADGRTDNQLELFSVPLDASAGPVLLSGLMIPAGDVADFAILADSTRVVFRADAQLDGATSLFSSPIGGTRRPLRLNRAPSPERRVMSFALSADGSTAVWASERDDAGRLTLFRAPANGSEKPVEVSGPFSAATGTVEAYAVSADGEVVAYTATQDDALARELFARRFGASATLGHRKP